MQSLKIKGTLSEMEVLRNSIIRFIEENHPQSNFTMSWLAVEPDMIVIVTDDDDDDNEKEEEENKRKKTATIMSLDDVKGPTPPLLLLIPQMMINHPNLLPANLLQVLKTYMAFFREDQTVPPVLVTPALCWAFNDCITLQDVFIAIYRLSHKQLTSGNFY